MDPIFDALAEVTGLDPSTAAGRIGTAAAKLYKAKVPYTPDEIREFANRFWEFCPHAIDKNRQRPTPHEVAAHIGLLRAGPAPQQNAKSVPKSAQFNEHAANKLLDAMKPREAPGGEREHIA